ncbi:hypothetical protein HK102_009779, partial [Quaeritorhiza haematococci]
MARVARLCLFAANTFLLLLGIALSIFSYMTFLGTSPFSRADMFPRNVLIGTTILGITAITAGISGCCTGYRQHPRLLLLYALLTLLLTLAHFSVGFIAFRNADTALRDAEGIWLAYSSDSDLSAVGGNETEREVKRGGLLVEFRCCGWESAQDTPAATVATATATANCPNNDFTVPTCNTPLTSYLKSQSFTIAVTLWVLLVFELGAFVGIICLWLGLRNKERRDEERAARGKSNGN